MNEIPILKDGMHLKIGEHSYSAYTSSGKYEYMKLTLVLLKEQKLMNRSTNHFLNSFHYVSVWTPQEINFHKPNWEC